MLMLMIVTSHILSPPPTLWFRAPITAPRKGRGLGILGIIYRDRILNETELPARRRLPLIAADAGGAIEDFRRVVFPLDGLELGEVLAIKVIQVVWVIDGGLKPDCKGGREMIS